MPVVANLLYNISWSLNIFELHGDVQKINEKTLIYIFYFSSAVAKPIVQK